MAITIKLNTAAGSAAGIDFNQYFASYFADFEPTGFPYILGGESNFDGDQIVLLDEIEATPADTKSIVLDGKDFFYHFSGHDLSGTLTTVRLATLGPSYNAQTKSFTIVDDHISNVSTAIEISGLMVSNPQGAEDGAFDQLVLGLMGGAPGSNGFSDPTLLENAIWAQAHNVTGSQGGDVYNGTMFADTVSGNGGSDTLDGGVGADILNGGLGNDLFIVDSIKDKVIEQAGQGIDTVNASVGFTLSANVEVLNLIGNAATAGIGNELANTITGNAANNTLNGAFGADRMIGGLGNDIYLVDNAADKITELAGQGIDQIRSAVATILPANVENLMVIGNADVSAFGNTLNNSLAGNVGANLLSGGLGDDTINGGAGADTIYGGAGAGADRLLGGAGPDVFQFSSLADSTFAVVGRDIISDFAEGDKVMLSAIDANTAVKGNQAFHFIGGDSFSSAAGEVRFVAKATETFVYSDVNGDGIADFSIRLIGNHILNADDFIL